MKMLTLNASSNVCEGSSEISKGVVDIVRACMDGDGISSADGHECFVPVIMQQNNILKKLSVSRTTPEIRSVPTFSGSMGS